MGRKVVVRVLRIDADSPAGTAESVLRDTRLASALKHPNIVTIHDVVRSHSTVAIVMEHVEGTLLSKTARPLPPAHVLLIGIQIASALAAAHAAGVLHRNLGADAVMLRSDGQVKVLEFGMTPPDTFPATGSNPLPTAHKDVFDLGVLLSQLAVAPDQPRKKPSEIDAPLRPDLSIAIAAAMADDPESRPSATEFVARLRACESAAGDSSDSEFASRWPWLLVCAAALSILGLFLLKRPAGNIPQYEALTSLLPENHATAAAISLDGKRLVYANADGVFLRVLSSGETALLDGPREFIFDHLEWGPQSASVIASGFSENDNQPALWSISTVGSPPRELRTSARYGVPSPDGTRIAFVTAERTAVWTMSVGGEDARVILVAPKADTFPVIAWTPDGRHLLFQRRHYTGDPGKGYAMFERYYSHSLEVLNIESSEVTDRLTDFPVQSIASAGESVVLLLPDYHVGPDSNQLRKLDVNARTGEFRRPVRDLVAPPRDGRTRAVSISATVDGSTVAVVREEGQASIFVGEFEPAALRIVRGRRLTLNEKSNYPHGWTADSSAVVFESNRNGNWDIFIQQVGSSSPVVLAGDPSRTEVLPQLSPDGKYILYASLPVSGPAPSYTLMRIPVHGGPPQNVPVRGKLDEFRCGLLAHSRCVLRSQIDHEYFVYSELDPVLGPGRELARTPWRESLVGDWDVSPNGSRVALPNHDSRSASIRVVALDADAASSEREVALPGLSNVSGIAWAASGDGWFVSITTSVGKRVFYSDLDGRTHLIGDLNGWIVPARDREHVAWEHVILDSNVFRFYTR